MNVPMSRWFLTVLCGLVMSLAARAANPPPTQLFYVPFPEDQQLQAFDAINTTANDPITVFVTFSAATDGTVIYYDHWEDGYERDITNPTQSTTLIFGDGNPANGYPPGNAADNIPAGTVFSLRNFVNTTTLQSVIDYDARDKIASYKPISLTKTSFPDGTDTLLAGCVEVFERGLWGTEYRSPVGVDMPTSTPASPLTNDENLFSYVALSISAGTGGASVQIDKDNNGSFEETVVLAEGESILRDAVNTGGRVLSNRPVQVVLFTGTVGSSYASRDTNLLPVNRWSSDYFSPVSTPTGNGTVTFLYNPGTSAITVNCAYRNSATTYSTSTVTVPAGGNAKFTHTPAVSGSHYGAYRFYTTGGTPPTFYAISTVDSDETTAGNNQNWDGGFTLVGRPSLTTQVLLSLGIGRDPYSSVSPGQNGNPLWICTVGNGNTAATVYVDYNGDNAGAFTDPNGNRYDEALSLLELEQRKLFDPDGDQSGMLVYSLNSSVKIAAAWAQDPTIASVAQPGLDVASLVPPLREGEGGKRSNLLADTDADGFVSAGDTLEYDIRGVNSARASIPGPFAVTDTLPTDVTYVPGSTRYRFSVNGSWQAWTTIPDNGTGTPFPLDGTGFSVPGSLGMGQQLQVTFNAVIDNYADLSTSSIRNTGSVEISPYGLLLPVEWTDPIYGSIGNRIWIDTDGDGVQDVGEAGLPNIDVFIDANNNGIWDSGEIKDTTDSNGDYLLAGLLAGTYTVRVDPTDIAAANVGYGPTYDLDGLTTTNVASVVLASAQDRVDADFGYRIGASVGDRVWLDRDADGVQENGEPGINGVRVYIDVDNDNLYDAGEPNTITSGDGVYYIGNLNPGTWAVRVDTTTLPAGVAPTFDATGAFDHESSVTLLAAEHRGDQDFGYRGSLSLGDLVWEDLDANGARVTYNVINGRIDINNSAATDNNDDGTLAGFNIINGYIDINGNGSIGTTDDGTFQGFTVIDGGLDVVVSGVIDGSDDLTAGVANEGPLANVRVYIDWNGNGSFDAIEPSATTNAFGFYSITNLYAGTWTVRVDTTTLPASYVQTYDLTSPFTDHSATVVLSASRTDVDFGYRNDATLGDLVWNDRDGDGVRDAGEPGIEGVLVFIDADADGIFDQATERYDITDVNGAYLIENLAGGTYNVRVEISTLPQGATQTFDLDGITTANVASRTLATSETATNVDFGYRSTASFGDFVWNDADADGVQDVGEAGINGVRVYADINGNGVFDSATEPSAVTNTSGAYSITNLMPGNFTARVDTSTLPAGFVQTYDLVDALDHSATFFVSAAQTRTDVDFGYTSRVTIGDFVWNDVDADGVQDVGESGIQGVTVTLFNSTNDTVVATTTTGPAGAYSFTDVMPGSYYVLFDTPAGYARTLADQGADGLDSDVSVTTGRSPVFTMTGGQTNNTIDAGFYQPASLGDFVWNDVDADGQQDVGETGLNGVTVTLFRPGFGADGIAGNADDALAVTSTTTAGGGAYSFTNLRPGTYQVNFGTLSGYSRTLADQGADASDSDANAGTGQTANIVLSPGASTTTVDAGYFQPASISDFVWNDANANGQQDGGETGLNGVTVTLFRPGFGADGIAGNADDALAVTSTTTAGGGAYSFTNLRPGTYQVNFGTLAGYARTLADQGADASDSDANAGTGQTANIVLSPGTANTTTDAGYYLPASLGDFVWNDANANGQQDGGETGLNGVTVTLFRPGFGADGIAGNADDALAVTSTTTSGGGAYSFTNLRPGTYQVNFGTLAGYARTLADQGADASDSDANAGTGQTANIVLSPGTANTSTDAGYYLPASLGDFVWNDANANGQQDGGETGLNGVTVTLFRPGFGADGIAGNADDALAVTSTTTAGGGAYSFTNLRPGTYQVNFGTLAGYARTLADQGADASDSDANAGTGQTGNIVLAAGASNTSTDAGYHLPASLGDFVWNDANANGQQDGGETGLDGVTVTLFRPGFGADGIAGNADDALAVATTPTAGGGAYSFTNLRPGTYQVNFGTLAGYARTLADQGAEASDSDANAGTGQTANIVLAAGASDITADAGYYQPASLGDFVWNDTNANGQQDGGETGLDGVTVTLFRPGFGADGIAGNSDDALAVATTSTAGGGAYSFGNLRPGTYQVNFGTLAGYARTLADQGADASDSDANAGTGQTANIVLAAGASNTTADAGYYQPASLGDFVWNDLNANGQQNVGEPGIDGVSVALYRPGFGADGISGNSDDALPVASTTTAGGGAYSFSNLRPGTYQVAFGTYSGYTRTLVNQGTDSLDSDADPVTGLTSTFALAAGQSDTSVDAGFYQPGIVTGHLYIDTNGDGNQDPGEPDLANVDVIITDVNGATQTVPTNSSGNWTATVPPGATSADVDGSDPQYPTGYTQTEGDDPTVVTAVSGSTVSAGNDGYFLPGSISGSVFADTDGDGDGDAPLQSVLLRLLDSAGSPVLNTLGQPVTTLTLADGSYLFPNLPPADYCVAQDQPSGYNSVSDTDGPNDNVIGNVTPISVSAGSNNGGNDFIEVELGSISGYVRTDDDNDGDGDTGLGGVLLSLLDGSGNPVLDGLGAPIQVSTNGSGFYQFTLVPPGSYRVSQTQPSGYASVSDVDGANNNLIGDETPIVITPGLDVTNRDFVEVQYGSISGRVFKDTNDDGTGDTVFPGVTVTLLDGSGNPIDGDPNTAGTQPVTRITGVDGSYFFDDLLPGTYRVSETQPSGYGSVSDVDGGDPDLIGSPTPITLNPGDEIIERDFVEIELGSISGYVFVGSTPLGGVTLTLLDENGDPVDGNPNSPGVQPITTVTSGTGFYQFTGVRPGVYQVGQTQPFGYDSFGDIDGGDINIIGDVTPIELSPGEASEDNNFVETLDTCPDDWAHWKFLHPSETPAGNPDQDAYDNFAEFAFAMPYDNGSGSTWLGNTAWIIRPSTVAPGTLEGVFVRHKGAPTNVTYTLQYAATPGSPTVWQSIILTPAMFSTVDNGDCTETVTIHDLETLTGLTGGKGVVRIQADLDDDGGNDEVDHTSYTEPEGWTETPLELCCRTYNNPYLRETAFTGTVSAVNGQVLTFAVSGGSVDLASLLGSGTFFLEVTSGENEGHRFDVVSGSGNTLTVAQDTNLNSAAAPFNTITGAPVSSLVGDAVELRRHWSLDELFPPASFGATGSQSTADQVQIFNGGAWIIYWLYDENDADPQTARWVSAADPGMADQGATLIPPGQGMFFNNRTSVTSILAYGEVRDNDFIRPLGVGNNLVGGGFPVDQAFTGTGSRAMSPATGFFGSRDFKTADTAFVWNADATIGAAGYSSYYLLNGAPTFPSLLRWAKVGDPAALARDAELRFLGNRATFLRSKDGNAGYTSPQPWAP